MWGAITPLILWLGATFRFEKPHFARNLAILVGFSGIVSVGYIGLYSLAIYLNFPPDFPTGPGGLWNLMHWIYWNHFTYFYLGFWVIIAVEQMLAFAGRSHQREITTKDLERQLTEARLAQLKAQIHPHFLFNTLNAVSALIVESKKDKAYDVVTRLSHLLRMGLEHGESRVVALSAEVEFSREYIELMAVRYPETLTFEFQISPNSETALVPSLILQPLIENAIKHGIGLGGNKTRVGLLTSVNDNRLEIEILNRNSGGLGDVGSTPKNTPENSGLGLKLTRERLQHFYGSDFNMVVSQPDAESTSVKLTLPMQYKSGSVNHT